MLTAVSTTHFTLARCIVKIVSTKSKMEMGMGWGGRRLGTANTLVTEYVSDNYDSSKVHVLNILSHNI